MSAPELEQVLDYITKRVIDYVKQVESPEGKVAKFHDPSELTRQQAEATNVSDEGQGIDGLKRSTEWLLENSVATWHPAFLEKLYAGTNPVGVASDILLSILNTNSHVFTASPAFTVIERYIGHKYAEQFGFTSPKSGGLTLPGGSYSNMLSMHTARSILHPETKIKGNGDLKLAVFASEHCHYSVSKSAIMEGLGLSSVFKVAVDAGGSMVPEDLDKKIEEAKAQGFTPFYVNATAGTTVYGSFDPLDAIADVTEKHKLWLHVDGSWGGNIIFSKKQAPKMKGSHRAQSITVNPHKMLGVPCTCSFLLVPDLRTFPQANSMEAEYLFHRSGDDDDELYDLADGTMGCGRRPDALKLYLAWQYYGSEGFANRIDHAFEMTEHLSARVAAHPQLALVTENPPPCLQTCFWFVPKGKTEADIKNSAFKAQNTKNTQGIATRMLQDSKFLVDFTTHAEYGHFFRIVLNSPAVTKELVDSLIETIVSIGNELN